MRKPRKIDKLFKSKPTLEGAGVHLKRAFGYYEVPQFDPFLLLDYFGSDNPDDYIAGFPWHPHRGIETVTYMIEGSVEHGDSMGNKGTIESGDVQWMTAGSGIIHQEMPQRQEGLMRGFQLWVNLPANRKMMPPRYQEIIAADVPELILDDNVKVKIIAGQVNGQEGPVKDIVCNPEYLDISIPPGIEFQHTVPESHNVFAYVMDGEGFFDPDKQVQLTPEQLILYGKGEGVTVTAQQNPLRFVLISGKPIGEPVAWGGPIVMNTKEELNLAFREYREGSFIK
jgi:redox-sensitive bicupin YhaK (pirin superfamily)